jgi:hypothetical protein
VKIRQNWDFRCSFHSFRRSDFRSSDELKRHWFSMFFLVAFRRSDFRSSDLFPRLLLYLNCFTHSLMSKLHIQTDTVRKSRSSNISACPARRSNDHVPTDVSRSAVRRLSGGNRRVVDEVSKKKSGLARIQ